MDDPAQPLAPQRIYSEATCCIAPTTAQRLYNKSGSACKIDTAKVTAFSAIGDMQAIQRSCRTPSIFPLFSSHLPLTSNSLFQVPRSWQEASEQNEMLHWHGGCDWFVCGERTEKTSHPGYKELLWSRN
jgi:hypothetical protein